MKIGGRPSQMVEMENTPSEPIPEHIKIAALGIIIVILAYGIYTVVM